MSLINQVLHDLDRRHRGAAVDQVLHDLLPAELSGGDAPWRRLLPWGLLALALLALALLWAADRAHAPHTREIPLTLPATEARPAQAAPVATNETPAAPAVSARTNATPETASAVPTDTPAETSGSVTLAAAPVAPVATSPSPAPISAASARDAARAALLAAERDWRPPTEETQAPAVQAAAPAAVESMTSEPAPAEESPGEMHIARSAAQTGDDANRDIARAEQMLARGDLEGGLARLRARVLAAPSDVSARERYVTHLLSAGRTAAAEAELRAGLAAQPRAARLAQTLAHLLFDRGDATGALATLLPAAPPVTSAPDYHAFIAALQQHAGEHAAAAHTWRTVLKVNPVDGRAWIGLGISLAAQDERQAARAAFAQARDSASLSTAMDAYAAAEFARLGNQP